MVFFVAWILIISFNFVSLPQAAVASNVEPYGYCDKTGEQILNRTNGSRIALQYGNMGKGACHIAFFHMVSVGKGSVWINGRMTSQFSKMLTGYQMAVV